MGFLLVGFWVAEVVVSTQRRSVLDFQQGSGVATGLTLYRRGGAVELVEVHDVQQVLGLGYFPLLVLKGTYHYWNMCIFSRGV